MGSTTGPKYPNKQMNDFYDKVEGEKVTRAVYIGCPVLGRDPISLSSGVKLLP